MVITKLVMKTCTRCRASKSCDDFHKNRSSRDGLHVWCKACVLTYESTRDPAHKRRIARESARRVSAARKAGIRPPAQYAAKPYTKKEQARRKFQNEVAAGRVTRQPCERCESSNADGHHDDYAHPLSVRWLCALCHAEEHRVSPPANQEWADEVLPSRAKYERCVVDGCSSTTRRKRGMCAMHYSRWRIYGDPKIVSTYPARRGRDPVAAAALKDRADKGA